MAPSLLLDPRAIVLSENLIFILTAGFTSAQSKIRPFIFAGLTGSTLYSLSTFSQYIQNTGYLGLFLGASLFTVPLVFFDRLILRHWDYKQRKAIFRAQGLEKTKKGLATIVEAKPTADEDTFGSRLAFGQAVSGSQRGVGESWEAKNTAHFSSKDPTYVPSAANFIAWELSKVLVCYFVYEWTVDVRAAIPHRMLIIPFFTRITEVSREEVWYRMVTNVTSWLGGWTLQTVIIGTVSAISVFFKPDEVYLWRPNFGSILDAWTVRRFWAIFWHQNLQNNFKNPARFLTHTVLRCPPGSLVARYTNITMIFFISALLHWASDTGGSVDPKKSGQIRFFMAQVVGIMLEDGVQELWRRAKRAKRNGREGQEGEGEEGEGGGKGERIVGYVWTFLFMSWSTAAKEYPQFLIIRKEEVSLRALLFGWWGWWGK